MPSAARAPLAQRCPAAIRPNGRTTSSHPYLINFGISQRLSCTLLYYAHFAVLFPDASSLPRNLALPCLALPARRRFARRSRSYRRTPSSSLAPSVRPIAAQLAVAQSHLRAAAQPQRSAVTLCSAAAADAFRAAPARRCAFAADTFELGPARQVLDRGDLTMPRRRKARSRAPPPPPPQQHCVPVPVCRSMGTRRAACVPSTTHAFGGGTPSARS
jgi:hypothetical protein